MTRVNSSMFLGAFVLGAIGLCTGAKAPDISDLVGDWNGTSVCQVKSSPCHDEVVVYHFSNAHDDKITIQADKIVDGKSVTMGSSDWTYDKAAHSLSWKMPRGTWKLLVDGDTIEGTLTTPDNVVFRQVHLRRGAHSQSGAANPVSSQM